MNTLISAYLHQVFLFCLRRNKILLFIIVLILLSQEIKGQNESKPANKLLTDKEIQNLAFDSVLVRMKDAIRNMDGENETELKRKLGKTLSRAKSINKPVEQAKANQLLADWHYHSINSENVDSIYHYDNEALKLLLKTNEKELISKAYRTVGMDLSNMQQFSKAEVSLFRGLEIAKVNGLEKVENSIISSLSSLYISTKDYSTALEYSKKVVDAYEKTSNTHPLIRALITQNDIYVHLGQPQKALEIINKALALTQKLPQENRSSEIINVRAWRANVYRELKQYDKSLEDYIFSWKGMEEKYGVGKVDGWKGGIGSIYHLQGKNKEAIPYLKDYINHIKGKKVYNPDELKKHYIWLAESLMAVNQKDSAYAYLTKGKAIETNALEEEIKGLQNELRIKYDTEGKNKTIASQSDLILQQEKVQTLSYVIGGLLVLLLAGLYFVYRNNSMKNAQLEVLNKNLGLTNAQLDKRNAENELLLKEIHHRVKNNLELVKSLLALQSAQLSDKASKEAMQASQNRVQSMGIIHQKLYQGTNLGSIEMRDYFLNLGEGVLDSFNAEDKVNIECAMENLELDVDTAVPIGLIVNELLTNALKYAFPDNGFGQINISLVKTKENFLSLKVADSGIGKTSGVAAKGTGFGTQLIKLLTQQLNGEMVEVNPNTVEFHFKIKLAA